jgi:predicted metal-dependent HD superfamily phosphohydrolase
MPAAESRVGAPCHEVRRDLRRSPCGTTVGHATTTDTRPPVSPHLQQYDANDYGCRVDADLRRWWASDVGTGHAAEAALERLITRYREPQRRYHTVNHVAAVRQLTGELLREVIVENDVTVRLAAWFHDAIYDPSSKANEAESADLARTELGALGVANTVIDAVARLILATAGHNPTSADEAVLLDADLAIFASQPASYQMYVSGIRFEYNFVDDAAFRKGRAAVLRSFLDRDVIFHTDAMKPHERQARLNLTSELSSLA